jgi:hypothetical protein
MKKPYEPVPGTIPALFIKHLRSIGPDVKLSTAMVLEAIGHPGADSLRNYMGAAIRANLVKAERLGPRNIVWSLGDGAVAPNAEAGATIDETADLAGPPPTPDMAAASPFSLGQAIALTTPEPLLQELQKAAQAPAVETTRKWPFKPAEPAAKAPAKSAAKPLTNAAVKQPAADAAPAADFLCALYSDGRLLIKSGSVEKTLCVDHTRQLLHYLDRIASEPSHG